MDLKIKDNDNVNVIKFFKKRKKENPAFAKACKKRFEKLEKRRLYVKENFSNFFENRNSFRKTLYNFRVSIFESINKLTKKQQKEIAKSLGFKRKNFLNIIEYDLTEIFSFDDVCLILSYLDAPRLLKELV